MITKLSVEDLKLLIDVRSGKEERVAVPGKWRAWMEDGELNLEVFEDNKD